MVDDANHDSFSMQQQAMNAGPVLGEPDLDMNPDSIWRADIRNNQRTGTADVARGSLACVNKPVGTAPPEEDLRSNLISVCVSQVVSGHGGPASMTIYL